MAGSDERTIETEESIPEKGNPFSSVYHFADEDGITNGLYHSGLSLLIGQEGIEILLVDESSKRLIWLEEFAYLHQNFEADFKNFVSEHPILRLKIWRTIQVGYKSEKFTSVPNLFLEAKSNTFFLENTLPFQPRKESAQTFTHLDLEISVLWTIEKSVLQAIQFAFEDIPLVLMHQASAILEAAMQCNLPGDSKNIFCFFEHNRHFIVGLQGSNLLYLNHFYFANENDVLYFLLLVYKELHFNPMEDKLHLMGDISGKSSIYEKISRYFQFTEFVPKPSFLVIPEILEASAGHRFFDLFALRLCKPSESKI